MFTGSLAVYNGRGGFLGLRRYPRAVWLEYHRDQASSGRVLPVEGTGVVLPETIGLGEFLPTFGGPLRENQALHRWLLKQVGELGEQADV